MQRITFLVLLQLLAVQALAETAYVTDNLRLGLHQAADTSDRAFRTLESGQQFEILDRDRNYAQVRLPDGVQGYVKVAYLVFDKPAKLIVAETQAEVERLQRELNQLKAAFAAPSATITSLEERLAEAEAARSKAQATADDLSQENTKYEEYYNQFKTSLPIAWVAAAMAVCLLAGFLFGLYWIDQRNRRRHGGIRVY